MAGTGVNVLVRIEPGPVAARVSDVLRDFRDTAGSLGTEVRLCTELIETGAPVPAPVTRRLFACGGREVTLWQWIDGGPGAGDPIEAGEALRACHAALATTSEPLEPWAMLREARTAVAPRAPERFRAELERFGEATARAVRNLGPLRPVHGDAHPGNFMWPARGVVLIDWEDAHLAPLEWDLACLVGAARALGDDFGWAEAALEAYGGGWDAEALARCEVARGFQAAAWTAALLERRPELEPRLEARLAWLRNRLA